MHVAFCVHNLELYKNIGVMKDLDSFVFTLEVTSLFKNRCFSLSAAIIASTSLLLMSFCVFNRLSNFTVSPTITTVGSFSGVLLCS